MKLIMTALTAAFFTLSTLGLTTSAMAAQSAAVDKTSCGKLANTTQPFLLVLNSNDDLIGSISQCAKDAKLMGASISGLGQIHDPVLAYFGSNPDDKPTLTTFSGYYELASLNGDITNNNGKYYVHIHAILADKNFRALAGHINSAKVGVTAEITITPFSSTVERTVNPETGFGLIVH